LVQMFIIEIGLMKGPRVAGVGLHTWAVPVLKVQSAIIDRAWASLANRSAFKRAVFSRVAIASA
jgi:hypothetical protein